MKKRLLSIFVLLVAFMVIASSSFAASLLVTWNANDPAEGVTGYNIYDKVGTGLNVKVGTVSTTTFTIPSVVEGTHTVTVTAFDAAGNESPPSLPVSILVDTIAPTAPTNLKIQLQK